MKYLAKLVLAAVLLAGLSSQIHAQSKKQKALIIDGQNNHYVWPKTTMMIKDYLEETDLFEVNIHRMDSVWLGIKYNKSRPEAYTHYIETYPLDGASYEISHKPIKSSRFSMDFGQYDVLILNLGAATPMWPDGTQKDFEKFIADGGGLVVIHAADNMWGQYEEYNQMIALGAWGDRDSTTGPFVYYNKEGELEMDHSEGRCGSHGAEFEFVVTTRAPEHPIMKGLPTEWMHGTDELYEKMRGPFKNATILATAWSDKEGNSPPWNPKVKGMDQNVGTMMVTDYGKGRVFHTTMGHFDYSMECVGFITTLQRGTEWAATGNVTQAVPKDFPGTDKAVYRKWGK